MLEFVKKMFTGLLSFGGLGCDRIKCVSSNNQPCQARPILVNVNFN